MSELTMTATTEAPSAATPWRQRSGFGLALAVVLALAVYLAQSGWRSPGLLVLGTLCGLTLMVGRFGFTGGWRKAILLGDRSELSAQIAMVGLTTLLLTPVIASGIAEGLDAPAGLPTLVGAFLFGIGMQLAGGCGSGTLSALGGGNTKMILSLAAFCTGGFVGSLHTGWWDGLPGFGVVVLGERLGWTVGIAAELLALGGLALWLARSGDAQRGMDRRMLVVGAVIAVLSLAILLVSGHPWSITWGMTLWGAQTAQTLGWDPSGSAFWQQDWTRLALAAGPLGDAIPVMDVGLMLGAMLGSTALGRFAPSWRIDPRHLAAAVVGGFVMGYGSRISWGCNIGAFVSGIASTSLHGWLWLLAVWPGNVVGVRLRPLFNLPNETCPPRP